MYTRVLRKLAGEVAKTLFNTVKKLGQAGGIPSVWKKRNITFTFKKGRKEDLGNYRPISLTSVPAKIME